MRHQLLRRRGDDVDAGIILPSTGRGQRLNNHAAILRSKNVMGDGNHQRLKRAPRSLLEPVAVDGALVRPDEFIAG
jgi:hypothetical protein